MADPLRSNRRTAGSRDFDLHGHTGECYKIRLLIRIAHSSLPVADLDRSIDFYVSAYEAELLFREPLAEEIAAMTGIPMKRCQLAQLRFAGAGELLELIEFSPDEPPGLAHVCFQVDSVNDELRRLEPTGARCVGGPVRFPEGSAAYVREPGGSLLEVSEIDATAVA